MNCRNGSVKFCELRKSWSSGFPQQIDRDRKSKAPYPCRFKGTKYFVFRSVSYIAESCSDNLLRAAGFVPGIALRLVVMPDGVIAMRGVSLPAYSNW
jgi:hypothetical protein